MVVVPAWILDRPWRPKRVAWCGEGWNLSERVVLGALLGRRPRRCCSSRGASRVTSTRVCDHAMGGCHRG
jgi:hypothetical protein